MRCFIGVHVAGRLSQDCRMLAMGLPAATPRPNLHMTLAFLGERPQGFIDKLCPALSVTAAQTSPFTLTFDRCEPFPAAQGPFLALTTDAPPQLLVLHQRIWDTLVNFGVIRESRALRPHITLAKPGQSMSIKEGQWPLPVNEICLYASEPGQQGGAPSYRPLSRFALADG
ncbi:RNA 2',3'-cyclic phosphodiesterase [Alcanivorax sp. DP30]|uniref:RNA 2',3'-cyclic phosphodiesterase n=1 Tax=Alcanivorax sp. DP30 TaxID=2606217 RepID=UPI00136C0E69|nr:RNA 2',3'-cyclic phosphodiesterase [Alcanivorax sp. DP30]